MREKYLFPYRSRFLGLFMVLAHIPIVWVWETMNNGYDLHGMQDNLQGAGLWSKGHLFFIVTSLLVLIGLFLIAWSKEKIEDEQIGQLRLDSLRWAIYLNYLILILNIVFTNGIDFVDMLRLNLWIPLVFFIIRFRWVIYRLNRASKQG